MESITCMSKWDDRDNRYGPACAPRQLRTFPACRGAVCQAKSITPTNDVGGQRHPFILKGPTKLGVVMKNGILFAVTVAVLSSIATTDRSVAQDEVVMEAFEQERPLLVDEQPTSAERRALTAAEIRQARALYQTQQRIERMERNAWAGYDPLRPGSNPIPMMSSRYSTIRIIRYPFFYYAR